MATGPLFFYLLRDILAEIDPSAFRNGDRWTDLLFKIVFALSGQCSCSRDSEFALLRRWLIAIGGSCFCNDSIFSLYQRILTQTRLNAGNPNTPGFEFRAGDTVLDILRKLLNNLQNPQPGPVPPIPPFDACCPPPGSPWGFVFEPATVSCDFGFVYETPDCVAEWGTVP